jgi:prepilin-type N-terminal cleavage/methylation domain-containing protein
MNICKKNRAFTLIEVLIATAIFAIAMIMTTGIVSQSVSYQTKLHEIRVTANASRKIADMISRDIRDANAEGTINVYDDAADPTSHYSLTAKDGVAILVCRNTSTTERCNLIAYTVANNSTLNANSNPYAGTGGGNALVIFNKQWTKVYYSEKDACFGCSSPNYNGYNLYYKQYNTPASINISGVNGRISSNTILSDVYQASNQIGQNIIGGQGELRVLFNGYGKATGGPVTTEIQSYVGFDVLAQSASSTQNYGALPPQKRARAEISSLVTVRNYSP